MKNKGSNEAVSDIVGTVLLLGMTISLFSVLCIGVLSYPSSPSSASVNLVGTINDGNLYLEHCGGEALDLDTKVIITIGDNPPVSIIVGDQGYLNEEAKEDNLWGIGEGFIYEDTSMIGKHVKIAVVDVESNSVIMLGSLQGT